MRRGQSCFKRIEAVTPEKCDPAEQAKKDQELIWKRIHDDAQAATRHTKASIETLSSALSIARSRVRDAVTLFASKWAAH